MKIIYRTLTYYTHVLGVSLHRQGNILSNSSVVLTRSRTYRAINNNKFRSVFETMILHSTYVAYLISQTSK